MTERVHTATLSCTPGTAHRLLGERRRWPFSRRPSGSTWRSPWAGRR